MHKPNKPKSFYALRPSNNPTSPNCLVRHKSISEPYLLRKAFIQPNSTSDSSSEEELTESDDSDSSSCDLSETDLLQKIADLRLLNKSLLCTNKVLETTIKQQARHVASLHEYSAIPMKRDVMLHQTYRIECEQNDRLDRLRRKTELMIEEGRRALAYRVRKNDCVLASNGDHYRLLRL